VIRRFGFIAAAWAALAAARPASACTTFMLERGGDRVVGKSYDWYMGQGLVFVNKRGVEKQSLPVKPGDKPAHWLSRHASVTFNQYGREFPTGGMNDAGLVVEVMWLDSSEYERADRRPTLNELQWIQYQLDSFGTVAEMTAAAASVRVSPVYARVHYLACDRSGACAAFEHVGGRQVVTPGARALTNHTYAESVAWASQQKQPPAGAGSLERFARASRQAAAPPTGDLMTAAFGLLDNVRWSQSQWNIVYDPMRLRVSFRTRVNRTIKTLDLGKMDASCAQPPALVDIDTDPSGDVADRLRPYDQTTNRSLIERSLRRIRGQLPAGAVDMLVSYPSALTCKAPEPPASPASHR
jgi:choloylglycine hydrolase